MPQAANSPTTKLNRRALLTAAAAAPALSVIMCAANADASPDSELLELQAELREAIADYRGAEERSRSLNDQAEAARIPLPDICRRDPDDDALFGRYIERCWANRFGSIADDGGEPACYYGYWHAKAFREELAAYGEAIKPLADFQVRRKARLMDLVQAFDATEAANQPYAALVKEGERLIDEAVDRVCELQHAILAIEAKTPAGLLVKASAAMAHWMADADSVTHWIAPDADAQLSADVMLDDLARNILLLQRREALAA